MFNRYRQNGKVKPSPENPPKTPASSMREIWEYAESARSQVLQSHLKELVKWMVERISIKLLKGGAVGELDVAFIEASRNIDCENVFAPDFLRFDSIGQKFVTPCGSEFQPDEVLRPISERLKESGIEVEFRIMVAKNMTTTLQISYHVNQDEPLSSSVNETLALFRNGEASKNGSSSNNSVKQGA